MASVFRPPDDPDGTIAALTALGGLTVPSPPLPPRNAVGSGARAGAGAGGSGTGAGIGSFLPAGGGGGGTAEQQQNQQQQQQPMDDEEEDGAAAPPSDSEDYDTADDGDDDDNDGEGGPSGSPEGDGEGEGDGEDEGEGGDPEGDGAQERPKKRRRKRSRFRKMSPHLESVYSNLAAAQRARAAASAQIDLARLRVLEAQRAVDDAMVIEANMGRAVEAAERNVVDAELAEPGVKWNMMYFKLVEYKERHGDTLVPYRKKETDKEVKALATWVNSQRCDYRRPQSDGRSLKNKPWQIAALDRLGFVWNALEASWEEHFAELVRFKAEHGHANVPAGYRCTEGGMKNHSGVAKNLPSWLQVQRTQYRVGKEGKKSNLTDERRRRLEELGVVWSLTDDTWNRRYEELVEFKARHGHTRIKARKGDPLLPLLQWTRKQRDQYRQVKDGKKAALTTERIRKLQEVGLYLDVKDDKWHAKYREMVAVKERTGNAFVVRGDSLYQWFKAQQKEYNDLKAGKESEMTPERIELLNKIDFVWGVGVDTSTMAYWTNVFEELRKFQEREGHFDVPPNYGPCPKLAGWVKKVRRDYRHHREGKAELEADKIRMLDEIGFDWRYKD